MKHLLILGIAILLFTGCGKGDLLQEANNPTPTVDINNELIIEFIDLKGEPLRDNFVLIDNVEVVTDIYGTVTVKDDNGDGMFIINIDKGDVIEQEFTIELVPEKLHYQVIVKREFSNENMQIDR